ncbi:hypothetical protein L7F22_022199 [Adiantum nelumboides]|nr:hypothetical protein [Adiantum nelumboides]
MSVGMDNEMAVLPAFLEKFPAWKNFPTGLHILVLDEDEIALQHAKMQLEACSYTVTPFSDRHTAMDALQQQGKTFHLAIVEINLANAAEAFKVVRAAKHLPTILLSAVKNVNLMMEGIAAGALEFLEKPLTEDNAKNLWQHVFRKALATGELTVPKHVVDNCGSVEECCTKSYQEKSQIKQEQADRCCDVADTLDISGVDCDQPFYDDYMFEGDQADRQEFDLLPDGKAGASNSAMKDFMVKSPGPSTPQLEQAETRAITVSGDESPHSQELTGLNAGLEDVNSSDDCSSFVRVKSEAEDMDEIFQSTSEGDELQSLHDFECFDAALHDGEGLTVHDSLEFHDALTLADDLVDELSSCIDMDSSLLDELPSADSLQLSLDCLDDDDQGDEEALLLAEVAKAEAGMARSSNNSMSVAPSICSDISGHEEKFSLDQSSKGAHSKKKMKVDWTPELHRRFVHAVEHLGVDKAIPSRILEIMGVQHLTRHNIASHLQKYRSHKKHMQAREAEAATWNQRRQMEAVRQPPQPQMVSRPAPLVPVGLHVWGHPTPEQYWPKPWQATDGSLWHQPPPVCMDAWGHPGPGTPFFHPAPLLRLPLAPIPGSAINRVVPVLMPAEAPIPGLNPSKDKVDAAISEVLKNPFTPLPLGLKPPILESVLSELQRQGMKTVPPSPP